jgi:predicted kinase
MRQHIQLTCGMIASSKSTYALSAAKKGFVIVNDDSLSQSIHGGDYTLYDKTCTPIYKAVGISILTHALTIGKSVVVDVGNRKRHIRQRWIALAHMFDVPSYAIVFPKEVPEVHARRRYDSDHRGISFEKWLEVARRHDLDWQPVLCDQEGFKDVIDVHWPQVSSGWVFVPGD